MGIRAMFSGVSGLEAHSTWLDVIGNNISNTNTVAYKASRVEFADQISQTLNGALPGHRQYRRYRSRAGRAGNQGGFHPAFIHARCYPANR